MKKLFILFVVITNMGWCKFKLDVNDTISRADLIQIINDGWDENNTKLNKLIVKNSSNVLSEYYKKIKKPFEVPKECKTDPNCMLHINLNRDDLDLMLSYAKYLETKGKNKEAKQLYIRAIQGARNITNDQDNIVMLSPIMRLVFEDDIVSAVKHGMQKSIYSKSDILEFINVFEKNLMFDTETIFTALKHEKGLAFTAWNMSSEKEKSTLMLPYVFNARLLGVKFCYKKIGKYIKKYSKENYKMLFDAMHIGTKEALDKYNTLIRERSRKLLDRKTLEKMKKDSKQWSPSKNCEEFTSYIAKIITNVAMPKITETFLDMKKHVEENKAFIDLLHKSL